ncbi:sialidase family protein [Planctomicrobium sp. SH661]|uniref:sialidase family protein n=1 Tax=Planctomicrobium sp. SH661 TaxID=3448124 RepID=UPI003F5B06D3
MVKLFSVAGTLSIMLLAALPILADTPDSPSFTPQLSKKQPLETIDLSSDTSQQSIVARGTEKIYQGHPHTLLMPDGKTILAAWTYGHGGVCGPLKRSDDGGLTWSELLPVPKSWSKVRNCPTLHRIVGPDGVARVFAFAGNGAMYQAVSLDDGQTFSEMKQNGLKTIVAPISIGAVEGGTKWLMWYHRGNSDDPVDEHQDQSEKAVWQSASTDGGLTWGDSRIVCEVPGAYPCEPAVIRSPDGRQLLMCIRENTRKFNSLFITSDDEGQTWSNPKELTASLTGDRHLMRYAPDGRMVVVFRDRADGPTKGHFVAWVGAYEDVIDGREGEYRIKLLHHLGRKFDTGYPGLDVLPDGTFVATTYVQLKQDEKNSVVAVRFKLDEVDQMRKSNDAAVP